MSNFEAQYLVTQYGILLGQFILLGATLYFYNQLVINDNAREKRVKEDNIKRLCKHEFERVNSPGSLQTIGVKVRKLFPDNVTLIIDAYHELYIESPSTHRPAKTEFIKVMEQVEKGIWDE